MLSALDTFDTGEKPPQEWWVGERKILSGQQYPYSKYCELWNPKKEMVQRNSDCFYIKEIVNDNDDGNWTYVYGINGKVLEDTIVRKITVNKGKGTSLLCIIEISYSKLYYKM
jgi:hypothetical protein